VTQSIDNTVPLCLNKDAPASGLPGRQAGTSRPGFAGGHPAIARHTTSRRRPSRRKLTTAQKTVRRELRHSASILRKAGLYRPKVPRKPNLRYVRRLLKEYGDVVQMQAKAIKVTTRELPELKAAGYRVRRNRVIVPAKPYERVRMKKTKEGRRPVLRVINYSDTQIIRIVNSISDRKDGRVTIPLTDEERLYLTQLALANRELFITILKISCRNYDLRRTDPKAPLLNWPDQKVFDDYAQLFYYHTNVNCALIAGLNI
jgi:hypothetical protein